MTHIYVCVLSSVLPTLRIDEFDEIHEFGEVDARLCPPHPKNR